MPSNLSNRRVSPLRAHMIEDMTVRGFTEKTRQDYVRHVQAFAAFIGRSPATATPGDIRGFQLHQRQSGMQPPSINTAVSALRFLFTVTLDRPELARRLTVVRQPRRLPSVLSVEEVTLLLQAAPGPKYEAAFATAYGAGLRVSEVVALKVGDVDSERMLLGSSRARGARACPRESGGSPRHAVAATARSAARVVARGPTARCIAAAGLAVPEPQSGRSAVDPSAQPRRSRRRRGGRDQKAGVAAYPAAQLCHPSLGTEYRYPCHPSAARSRDILPANT